MLKKWLIKKGWIDVTWLLRLVGVRRTFGRRIVVRWTRGDKFPFMRMVVPNGVQVMGLTPEGQVVAITEVRKDTGEIYCHLVGGAVDGSEAQQETAVREFLEETGYRVGELHPLGTLHKESTHLHGATFAFLATDCVKVQEPEEGVNVTLMELDAFEGMLYEYVSDDLETPRGGGNSVITLWLARQWLEHNSSQERSG